MKESCEFMEDASLQDLTQLQTVAGGDRVCLPCERECSDDDW